MVVPCRFSGEGTDGLTRLGYGMRASYSDNELAVRAPFSSFICPNHILLFRAFVTKQRHFLLLCELTTTYIAVVEPQEKRTKISVDRFFL